MSLLLLLFTKQADYSFTIFTITITDSFSASSADATTALASQRMTGFLTIDWMYAFFSEMTEEIYVASLALSSRFTGEV
jgi:hypothetical protein